MKVIRLPAEGPITTVLSVSRVYNLYLFQGETQLMGCNLGQHGIVAFPGSAQAA